jgi:nitrogen fixation protein FixH
MREHFDGPARQPQRLTGWGVLLALFGMFGAVVVANAALTFFALRSLPGGLLANSYDVSQTWNQRIADAHAQDARGWRALARVNAAREGARVVFEISDASGSPVRDLAVSARFEHPSDRRLDRTGALLARDSGYESVVPGVGEGAWMLEIEAQKGGERLFVTRNRVTLSAIP